MKKTNIFLLVASLATSAFIISSCSHKGAAEKEAADTVKESIEIASADSIQPSSTEISMKDSIEASPEKDSFIEDLPIIKERITRFYNGTVLFGNTEVKGVPWEEDALGQYCTKSLIKEMKKNYEYEDGDGLAVWILRNPDITDSDPRDRVISVKEGDNHTLIVTYLDCGVRSKTKLFMKEDGGVWKIDKCKFLSGHVSY